MLSPAKASYLQTEAKNWEIALNADQLAKLGRFYDLLVAANQQFNLTRIVDEHDVVVKHFLDSLSVLTVAPPGPLKFVDIGTGAGFPAIPLLIARPDWKGLLVDSIGKKVRFLQDTIQSLQLPAVAVQGRAEELGQDPLYREQFDLAIARAVGPLSPVCEYGLPLVRVGGHFIAMRGRELEKADAAIHKLGGEIIAVSPLELAGMQRHLVVVKKVRPTPKSYPRRAGQPTSKPL